MPLYSQHEYVGWHLILDSLFSLIEAEEKMNCFALLCLDHENSVICTSTLHISLVPCVHVLIGISHFFLFCFLLFVELLYFYRRMHFANASAYCAHSKFRRIVSNYRMADTLSFRNAHKLNKTAE